MIKYCKILDDKTGLVQLGAGCSDLYYEEIGMVKREVAQSDIDYQYYLAEKCPMKTEEQKEEEKKKMISLLSMTKLDLVNELEKVGITYSEIKDLLSENPEAQKQWELCERVYRFNPLLETYTAKFGISGEQLDEMFKEVNNGV